MINSLLNAFRFVNRTLMTQEDLPIRSLNYTKIDHCQVNQCFHNDEFYRQICLHPNEHVQFEQEYPLFRLCLTNRLHFIVFLFLISLSHTHALPIYQNSPAQYLHQPTPYRTYQRYPIQQQQQINQHNLNSIPSYSNGAYVQIYNPQSLIYVQNSNQLQIKRERQRRAMIDKLVVMFDEDGNGQLTKDELYSMALRSNMFPKFHQFLKQTF